MESQARNGVVRAGPIPSNVMQILDYVFRSLAIVLLAVSTILLGLAEQTTVVRSEDRDSGEMYSHSVTTKSTYFPALIYLLVANVISGLYSILSLVLSIINRLIPSIGGIVQQILSILDVVVSILLFSAIGAAFALALLLENGNTYANWPKLCSGCDKFCGQMLSSIIISLIASVVYIVLFILGAIQNKTN